MEFDLPSTWVKFRPSLCDGCHALCCTLPVEVDDQDLLRLGLITEDEANGSLKKVARRLMEEKIVHSYRAKSRLFLLQQKFNSDCIFLGPDRRCTVYERRPKVCREFPEIGPRSGYCPEARKVMSSPTGRERVTPLRS